MAILSILVIISAGVAWVLSGVKMNMTEWDPKTTKRIEVDKNPLKDTSGTLWGSIIGVGFVVWVLSLSIFFSQAGKQYFIVSPTGNKTAIMTEGLKLVLPLSKVTTWDKFIDVRVASENMDEDALEELEGVMSPVGIRFVDQVTANAYPAVRFQLPNDPESFIAMAIKYRSVTNLVNNTLIPTIKEQVLNTGYMFSAQDYISGEAQNFRQTFEEQLKDGAYKVKKVTLLDTTYNETIGNASKNRTIKNIKTSYKVEKVEVNGKPIRIPTEITTNNIIVSQVILDKVDLNAAFKKRLEAQRDESAKRQLEEQKVKTAKTTQQRIIAEGESKKAAERVAKEQEAIGVLIAMETNLKEERTKKDLAKIQLETQKISAQTVKVKADAEAYAIAKKVRAGITPEKELQMRLDADVAKVKAIAGLRLPETMFMGSQGGNDGILSQLIGADIAKSMKSSAE